MVFDMGIRKVEGGKKIDRWAWEIDGREVAAEVFMRKVRRMHEHLQEHAVSIDDVKDDGYYFDGGTVVFHAVLMSTTLLALPSATEAAK
jgi:hypothetical protein